MFEDDFSIRLAGFSSSNGPLTYALYGITSFVPLQSIRLSAADKNLTGGGVTETRKLPFLVGLQARVSDKNGEVTVASTNVTVQNDGADSDWLSVAKNIKSSKDGTKAQKWQYYAFVANQVNVDAGNGMTTEEDALDTNLFIAEEAILDS